MPRMSDKDREEFKIAILEEISAGKVRRGIKQTELAQKCGIPNATFSYRVKHPGTFRIDELLAIANVLDISPARLCGRVT